MIMSMRVIESKENRTYKDLIRLKKGDSENGRFLLEGEDLVEEAKRGNSLCALLYPEGTKHIPETNLPTYILKEGLYRELANYRSLPPLMGIGEKKLTPLDKLGKRLIYLDRIQDPGNAGTMMRTALSFSYDGLVLSPDSVSLYNSKCVQSSKGALFSLPIARGELSTLHDLGYHIFLTTLDGEDESKIKELPTPFVLVFGNEGQGVSKKNMAYGEKLRIEMSGIDSLNVAVAAGIFMYRFQRR